MNRSRFVYMMHGKRSSLRRAYRRQFQVDLMDDDVPIRVIPCSNRQCFVGEGEECAMGKVEKYRAECEYWLGEGRDLFDANLSRESS